MAVASARIADTSVKLLTQGAASSFSSGDTEAATNCAFKASILAAAWTTAWPAAPEDAMRRDASSKAFFDDFLKAVKRPQRNGSCRGGVKAEAEGLPHFFMRRLMAASGRVDGRGREDSQRATISGSGTI